MNGVKRLLAKLPAFRTSRRYPTPLMFSHFSVTFPRHSFSSNSHSPRDVTTDDVSSDVTTQGNRPSEVFPVALTDINPFELRRFQTVSYGLEAVIPKTDLLPMINDILAAETKPSCVMVDIESKMTLQVQNHSLETDPSDRHVWFQWNNWSALKTATNLVDKCGIWLVTDPKPHIMFRFDLGQIGDFVFIKSSDLMYGNNDFRHLGTFRSFFSR